MNHDARRGGGGMIRRLVKNAWQALRGGMRQRVTRSGAGFVVSTATVATLAFVSGNNLLFLILACLLGGLIIASFLSRLSLAGLELDFVFPEHVPARRQAPARMKLRNEKSWMPSFSILVTGAPGSVFSSVLYFPVLPAGTVVDESVLVQFARRGQHSRDSFRLQSGFPFGFADRVVEVVLRREVLVYPCLDPQPGFDTLLKNLEGELEAMARGRGYDFYRIRPYEHLESARHVDWKATAHTGDLQVREFAREQEPLVEFFLDLAIPLELAGWFEQAVDCCAYLAWEVALRGCRIRFRTQDFDVSVPVEGDVYTILKYLALVEPRGRGNIVGPGREDSLQVVVSARPARLAAAGWHDAHVLGVDTFGPAPSEPGQGQPAGAGADVDHGDRAGGRGDSSARVRDRLGRD